MAPVVSGGATAPRLLPRAPLPPQRPAGLTGPPRPHGATGPRRPAHGPSPAVPLPSLGLLLVPPLPRAAAGRAEQRWFQDGTKDVIQGHYDGDPVTSFHPGCRLESS